VHDDARAPLMLFAAHGEHDAAPAALNVAGGHMAALGDADVEPAGHA
jgi:hypothetical protein